MNRTSHLPEGSKSPRTISGAVHAIGASILLACLGFVFFADHAAESQPLQGTPPTPQDIYLATQADRERWNAFVETIKVAAAEEGYEHGFAGFHLLRPVDDKTWIGNQHSPCSGAYCWDSTGARYSDTVYCSKTLTGGEIFSPPADGGLPMVIISVTRIFANAMATLTIEDESVGVKRLTATFDRRAISALNVMLQPIGPDGSSGWFDWFGTPRDGSLPDTDMRVVLVHEDKAYVPLSISSLVALGPGPHTVIVATGLTIGEATTLRDAFVR